MISPPLHTGWKLHFAYSGFSCGIVSSYILQHKCLERITLDRRNDYSFQYRFWHVGITFDKLLINPNLPFNSEAQHKWWILSSSLYSTFLSFPSPGLSVTLNSLSYKRTHPCSLSPPWSLSTPHTPLHPLLFGAYGNSKNSTVTWWAW